MLSIDIETTSGFKCGIIITFRHPRCLKKTCWHHTSTGILLWVNIKFGKLGSVIFNISTALFLSTKNGGKGHSH